MPFLVLLRLVELTNICFVCRVNVTLLVLSHCMPGRTHVIVTILASTQKVLYSRAYIDCLAEHQSWGASTLMPPPAVTAFKVCHTNSTRSFAGRHLIRPAWRTCQHGYQPLLRRAARQVSRSTIQVWACPLFTTVEWEVWGTPGYSRQ